MSHFQRVIFCHVQSKTTEDCPACFGTGKKHYLAERSCGQCNGTGKESYWDKSFFGNEEVRKQRSCSNCGGSGRSYEKERDAYTGIDLGWRYF